MAKFDDVIEQMLGAKPNDISKDIAAAKNSGNRALVGLLNQKQNIAQNIQKMQNDMNKLDLQIAQAKLKLATGPNKGTTPAGNTPPGGAA